jgi:PAS domain S-box-containing protein
MNEQLLDHNLIEYMLTLLEIPESEHMDTEQLMEANQAAGSSFVLNPSDIQRAQEIIKFMDEMPGGFLIYHADGNEDIIYANKALLRIFRCDTLNEFKELTGNSFKGIVHPYDLDTVEKSIKKQIADSQYDLDYVEYRAIRKDGSICWIEDFGHYLEIEGLGGVFYVFLTDATAKKNHYLIERAALIDKKEQKIEHMMAAYDREKKLIHQEHLRRLEVIEGLSINYDSILYADLDSDRIFPYRLSSRTKRQFDDRYQIVGFHWYVVNYVETWVHPEDREMVAQLTDPDYIRKKLSKKKTYYINYRVINNGELQYLQLRIVNVGKKEKITQIVMGYRRVDVEVMQEMEQKQILEDALDKANLAIVAKNTFLSNMSHDMRTPLNAIFGFSTLARQQISDKEAVLDYLDKIETAGSQLLDLIEKVLQISWTESNDAKISESECNLSDILEEVHGTLLPQAAEKDISFILDSQKLLHENIYGDADKLRQVLLYLANNAVTYTNFGGRVELTVRELEVLPNHFVTYEFCVIDNGIGISKDFIAHIFEPFERENNTTFSGIHGTGVSLAIAKKIINMMGGKIEVESAVGKGSTFTVTLRLRVQDSHVHTTSEDMPECPTDLKILLVEDNMINMKIETEILRTIGFTVETAENGSIAVEKTAASAPGDFDLILMDIQMPVMDGRQAAETIRKLENPLLANIPIIALSANAFESDKRMSIESGMNAHLTKPMDVPLLLETMGQVLKKHHSSTRGWGK